MLEAAKAVSDGDTAAHESLQSDATMSSGRESRCELLPLRESIGPPSRNIGCVFPKGGPRRGYPDPAVD